MDKYNVTAYYEVYFAKLRREDRIVSVSDWLMPGFEFSRAAKEK